MNWKSVWAVLAGLLVTVLITTLVDLALHAADVFPSTTTALTDAQSALALSYRIVISIFGAWLTARLAPTHPMKHALILGAIGTALALVGVAVTWNLQLGPHWYPIALAALALPQCWLGARLFLATGKRPHLGTSGHPTIL